MLIFLSLILSIVIISFIEYFVHRWIMHRRRLPDFVYRCIPFLNKTYEQHNFLHHRKYYEEFNYEPDPYGRDIDIELDVRLGAFLAFIVCIPIWFISSTFAIVFFFTLIAHHLIWNVVHSEMHRPKYTWFSNTRIYKFLAKYHWMHHTYPGKNYNVVFPFADYVMGAYIKPNDRDNAEMRKIGI